MESIIKKKSTLIIVSLIVITFVISIIDFYVLPEVNYQRFKIGKKPILMFLKTSYKDGGSKEYRGISYKVFYHHSIQPMSDESQDIKYEVGPEISYLISAPFRNEETKKETEIKKRNNP